MRPPAGHLRPRGEYTFYWMEMDESKPSNAAAGLNTSAMQQIIMNLYILKSRDLGLGADDLLTLNTEEAGDHQEATNRGWLQQCET